MSFNDSRYFKAIRYCAGSPPSDFNDSATTLIAAASAFATLIRASACPPARLITKPHLSIACNLPEQVYTKAMADYAQKTFHESFLLGELLLLKRQHQFDACKIVQVFRLKPETDLFLRDVA